MYRSDVPIRIKCAIEVEHAEASDELICLRRIHIVELYRIFNAHTLERQDCRGEVRPQDLRHLDTSAYVSKRQRMKSCVSIHIVEERLVRRISGTYIFVL